MTAAAKDIVATPLAVTTANVLRGASWGLMAGPAKVRWTSGCSQWAQTLLYLSLHLTEEYNRGLLYVCTVCTAVSCQTCWMHFLPGKIQLSFSVCASVTHVHWLSLPLLAFIDALCYIAASKPSVGRLCYRTCVLHPNCFSTKETCADKPLVFTNSTGYLSKTELNRDLQIHEFQRQKPHFFILEKIFSIHIPDASSTRVFWIL